MLSPNFFNTILVFPILNILVALYKLFLMVKLPGAFGFAIIALTILIRLLFQPFFSKQMETARKMQELKPHLDKLSEKHKNDKKQLQQEQLKLYQQAGINPASGCLFMIIQIPVFIALYSTLNLFLINGQIGKVISQINNVLYFSFLKISSIDLRFFGYNLAKSPAQIKVWYYLLIPVVTAILQYFQVQTSMPAMQAPIKPAESEGKDKGKKEENKDDFQKAMNTQMKFLFPVMIGWFSYRFPVGLSLYWNIFSLFGIMQSRKINPKSQIANNK
jgi:YidC/Oxa1 family membrane protein insertase